MDRPILFSGPMVRALLAGTKTQTRRVSAKQDWPEAIVRRFPQQKSGVPFAVGDRLWVREGHALVPVSAYRSSEGVQQAINPADRDQAAIYRLGWERSTGGLRWRPGIHMPRWASRLTLTVTDVRVQRVQWISDDDALAEGVERQDPAPEDWKWYRGWAEENGLDPYDQDGVGPVWLAPGTRQGFGPRRNDPKWGPTPQFAFRELWDSINAKRGFGWAINPWVVAVSFRCVVKNIDQMAGDE